MTPSCLTVASKLPQNLALWRFVTGLWLICDWYVTDLIYVITRSKMRFLKKSKYAYRCKYCQLSFRASFSWIQESVLSLWQSYWFQAVFCYFFFICAPLTDDIIGILGPNRTLATLQGPAFHTVSICKVSSHSNVWYVSYFIAKLSLILGVNPARTGYFASSLCRARTQSKTPLSQKFKVVHSCIHCNLYCCFYYFLIQYGFLSLWHIE